MARLGLLEQLIAGWIAAKAARQELLEDSEQVDVQQHHAADGELLEAAQLGQVGGPTDPFHRAATAALLEAGLIAQRDVEQDQAGRRPARTAAARRPVMLAASSGPPGFRGLSRAPGPGWTKICRSVTAWRSPGCGRRQAAIAEMTCLGGAGSGDCFEAGRADGREPGCRDRLAGDCEPSAA